MKQFTQIRVCLFIGAVFAFSSCAYYRVVPMYETHNTDTGERVMHYAIAENSVVVPELAIDTDGAYPESKESAWARCQARKREMAPFIYERYVIPHTMLYQTKRWALMIGLVIVSPITMSISYVSEKVNGGERSFFDCAKECFVLSYTHSVQVSPKIKNEYVIVPLELFLEGQGSQ